MKVLFIRRIISLLKMKSVVLTLATLFFIPISLFAQLLKPISWEVSVSKKNVETGETLELIFQADIDENWYLYSSDFDPDLGPVVTSFTFNPGDGYRLVDGIRPIEPQKKYDDIFEGEYTYFKKKGEFRQTVEILAPQANIGGSFEYQVCSDINGQCINFEDEFIFEVQDGNVVRSEIVAAQQQGGGSAKPLFEIQGMQNETETAVPDQAETEKAQEVESEEGLLTQRDPNDPYSSGLCWWHSWEDWQLCLHLVYFP